MLNQNSTELNFDKDKLRLRLSSMGSAGDGIRNERKF
jgi:hypothetical protein